MTRIPAPMRPLDSNVYINPKESCFAAIIATKLRQTQSLCKRFLIKSSQLVILRLESLKYLLFWLIYLISQHYINAHHFKTNESVFVARSRSFGERKQIASSTRYIGIWSSDKNDLTFVHGLSINSWARIYLLRAAVVNIKLF